MIDWKELLQKAVDAEGSSITAVSAKLDVSRTTISLVLADKYPAKTDKIAAKVMDTFARITCTHTGAEINHAECRVMSTGSVPTSSPQAMRQWRACQSCANKGDKPC